MSSQGILVQLHHFKAITAQYSPCTSWNHSFCIVENLHCNFHNVENSNCTYHILENITRKPKKYYRKVEYVQHCVLKGWGENEGWENHGNRWHTNISKYWSMLSPRVMDKNKTNAKSLISKLLS